MCLVMDYAPATYILQTEHIYDLDDEWDYDTEREK